MGQNVSNLNHFLPEVHISHLSRRGAKTSLIPRLSTRNPEFGQRVKGVWKPNNWRIDKEHISLNGINIKSDLTLESLLFIELPVLSCCRPPPPPPPNHIIARSGSTRQYMAISGIEIGNHTNK